MSLFGASSLHPCAGGNDVSPCLTPAPASAAYFPSRPTSSPSLSQQWLTPSKQYYAPNTNILHTKFLSEDSVGIVTDLLLPRGANRSGAQDRAALPWLIRKVECIHGTVNYRMECAPAFNYAQDPHTAEVRLALMKLPLKLR